MARIRKRPQDPVKLAKLVGDIATGQVEDKEPTPDEISRVMSALGKIGGPRGGKARASSLSKRRRVQIAKDAAKARWSKEPD
jgi:hypothetical protein